MTVGRLLGSTSPVKGRFIKAAGKVGGQKGGGATHSIRPFKVLETLTREARYFQLLVALSIFNSFSHLLSFPVYWITFLILLRCHDVIWPARLNLKQRYLCLVENIYSRKIRSSGEY